MMDAMTKDEFMAKMCQSRGIPYGLTDAPSGSLKIRERIITDHGQIQQYLRDIYAKVYTRKAKTRKGFR